MKHRFRDVLHHTRTAATSVANLIASSLFRSGKRRLDPDVTGMFIPPERLEALDPSDRLLLSYPRSGNTWVRHLLRDAIAMAQPSVPYPEELRDLIPDLHIRSHPMTHPAMDHFGMQFRIFKVHALRKVHHHRFVYLLRDPADVLVSFYHFHRLQESERELVKEGVDAFCHTMVGGWIEHVRLALDCKRRRPDDVLIVSYEELLGEGLPAISRIAEFFEIQTSEEIRTEALERNSFAQLRSKEEAKRGRSDEYFFRKGKRGSARDELKPETLAMLADEAADVYRAGQVIEMQMALR